MLEEVFLDSDPWWLRYIVMPQAVLNLSGSIWLQTVLT